MRPFFAAVLFTTAAVAFADVTVTFLDSRTRIDRPTLTPRMNDAGTPVYDCEAKCTACDTTRTVCLGPEDVRHYGASSWNTCHTGLQGACTVDFVMDAGYQRRQGLR